MESLVEYTLDTPWLDIYAMENKMSKESFTNTCEFCEKKFTKKKNLYQHLRRVHKIHVAVEGKLNCPSSGCKSSFSYYKDLRSHLKSAHCLNIDCEELDFKTMSDFREWKVNEENISNSFYCEKTLKRMSDGSKKFYFTCNRSGDYLSKSSGLRVPKRGTCKCGVSCPSTIEVHETPEKVRVTFYKQHVGHATELKHLPLSSPIKENLTGTECFKSINLTNEDFANTEEIEAKMNYMLSILKGKRLDNETKNSINKHLDNIIDMITDKEKPKCNKEPANKNIQQQRFFSTKKTPKKSTLAKPSADYKFSLSNATKNCSQALNIHYSNDHTYT